MAYIGVITHAGRILRAKAVLNAITHCALGEGNPSWGNNPPQPDVNQTSLVKEVARKRYSKKSFLIPDPQGSIAIAKDPDNPSNLTFYSETTEETNAIAIWFRFEEWEVVGATIREYGFFGDGVEYVSGVNRLLALNGVYDPVNNPNGQVLNSGKLYRVVNIPPKIKADTDSLEIVFFEEF
jgi:hypothetical protein